MIVMLYAIAFVLAALRVAGHKSQSFQAVAHLFVGGLLTEWWVGSLSWRYSHTFWIAVSLSIVELACFLWFRVKEPSRE
jgi:MFS family permease